MSTFENGIGKNGEGIKLTEGVWSDGTPWEFHLSDIKPDPSLCTAVFCVTTFQQKLLLVEDIKRGWELPGGHIEIGESIDQALQREISEETGAVLSDYFQFGFKKIRPPKPVPIRKQNGRTYPFPVSYIPYFYAEATALTGKPGGADIKNTVLATMEEARSIISPGHNHNAIFEHLIATGKINVR